MIYQQKGLIYPQMGVICQQEPVMLGDYIAKMWYAKVKYASGEFWLADGYGTGGTSTTSILAADYAADMYWSGPSGRLGKFK